MPDLLLLSKKYLEEFDGKSIFYACCQNGSQSEKNFSYCKVTSAVLISHFRGLLIVIFRTIKCNEEYQVINCCFLKLTLYWNSALKFMFLLNTPKTQIFFIFWLIVLFNAPLKKQIWCKIFVHGINRKIFRALPGNLSLKTLVLVGLITKR